MFDFNNKEEGIKSFEIALTLDPNNLLAIHDLAMLYKKF